MTRLLLASLLVISAQAQTVLRVTPSSIGFVNDITNSFEATQFTVLSTPHISLSSGAITTNLTFNGTSVIPANQIMQTQFNGNQHMNRAGISYNGSQYIIDNMATDSGVGRYGVLIDGGEKTRVDSGTIGWLSSAANTMGLAYFNNNDSLELGKIHSSTTDTKGYVYINSVAGVPTGVPVAANDSTKIAIVFDRSGGNLWFYSGGWQLLAKSPGGAVGVSGSFDTFYGYQSGISNVLGGKNSGFGAWTLNENTTGTDNTAMGYDALKFNLDGTLNTAIGEESLGRNVHGSRSTAVGLSALQFALGSDNTAVGYQAAANLSSSQDATYNQDVAVGSYAMKWIQGSGNVGVGYACMSNILGASSVVAVGNLALYSPTTVANTNTLSFSTFVGAQSGYGDGSNTNSQSVTDSYITSVGGLSGRDSSVLNTTAITNSIALGYKANFTNSNQAVIGNGSVTSTIIRGISTFNANTSAPTAITVGASPFSWTNNVSGPATVTVYIAGGTASEIDLNGTALGTGLTLSGLETVLLQPNEWVTVTYTVAPAMKYKQF